MLKMLRPEKRTTNREEHEQAKMQGGTLASLSRSWKKKRLWQKMKQTAVDTM